MLTHPHHYIKMVINGVIIGKYRPNNFDVVFLLIQLMSLLCE
ncbi:MAG: hypothetical protein PV340_01805 [Wolbachia sp.]|nr:hypothetical protein [Wolbachia sp.]